MGEPISLAEAEGQLRAFLNLYDTTSDSTGICDQRLTLGALRVVAHGLRAVEAERDELRRQLDAANAVVRLMAETGDTAPLFGGGGGWTARLTNAYDAATIDGTPTEDGDPASEGDDSRE